MTYRSCLVLAVAIGVVCARWSSAQATSNPHGPRIQDCASCHRSDAWKPVRISRAFKHAPETFPLTGAHATTTCRSCHVKLDFTASTGQCASCHRDPHLGTLSGDCARCHTTRSFVDRSAMLRSHQLTRFVLVGAHRAAACESCHIPAAQGQLRYAGRPTDCASCHQRQLLMAKTPDHTAAGFSTQCGSCHLPTFWNRAAFDHSGTLFPLTGAHRALQCASCHADAVYKGKPAACESCHLADYQATTNPAHVAIQFPTTCATCHATSRWQDATFNHDGPYFPIYSGKHRGTWSSCATCHTTPSNYKIFSCFECHGSTAMNDKHKEILGYTYTSTACYSCHRDGRKP